MFYLEIQALLFCCCDEEQIIFSSQGGKIFREFSLSLKQRWKVLDGPYGKASGEVSREARQFKIKFELRQRRELSVSDVPSLCLHGDVREGEAACRVQPLGASG